MRQCGLWPQEGSRGIRTDVEAHSQISLVVKDDVLSDEEKTKAGRSLQRVIQNGG